MTESFRAFTAQVPGMAIPLDAKLSPPEKYHYSHEAEKEPPFVLTQKDNQILIDIQAKQRVQIQIKYGLAGEFLLGHEKYCRDDMGRVTKC